MAALLPIPTPPPQSLFSPRRFSRWSHAPTTLTKLPSNLTALNPPSASLVDDSSPSPVSNPVSIDAESAIEDSDKLPLSGCKACGRGELEKGCNGEGRIQGGIATVPGFGWWPIKAYRPCPGFLASGGRYRRRGQNMDEVAFGRGGREASMTSTNEVQSK